MSDSVKKGMWSEDYINSLSDGAFLWIQDGGEKDDEWRTVPRALRHWPVRDDDYQIDTERLKAALPEVIDAPEEILPLTMKPAVLLNASRMLLREIEVEAPKAGMTPEIATMIGDLVGVLQAAAALAPAMPAEGEGAAPTAAPPETPAAPPPEPPPAETEAAKDVDGGGEEPTAKAGKSDDGWAAFEKRQREANHRATLLERKPVIRR